MLAIIKGKRWFYFASLPWFFGVLIEQLVDHGVVSRISAPVPERVSLYFVFGKSF